MLLVVERIFRLHAGDNSSLAPPCMEMKALHDLHFNQALYLIAGEKQMPHLNPPGPDNILNLGSSANQGLLDKGPQGIHPLLVEGTQ